jgi:peptide/nickel transport system substrate-binding protein
VFALEADPGNLDPAAGMNTAAARNVGLAIYETLVTARPDGGVDPNLAESIDVSPDGLTISLTLRSGVVFHDGEPFDSDAVVAHFTRLRDPGTAGPCGAALAAVTDVRAEGADGVVFEFSTPSASFPAVTLADPCGFIPSPLAVEQAGATFGQSPVGTGPFRLVRYSGGSEVEVERNPDYHVDGLPYLDGIVYRILPDPQTRFQSVQSGDVDMMTSLNPAFIEQGEDAGLGVTVNLGLGSQEVTINTTVAPLDDVRVRRALAMAIDRDALNAVLARGAGQPSIAPLPPDSPFLGDAEFTDYDPDTARDLLAEVGTPVRLTLLTSTDAVANAQLIQQMWGLVGVDVTIDQVDQGGLASKVLVEGDYQVAMWIGDEVANPAKMAARYSSTGGLNTARWSNDRVDQLFLDAATTADVDEVTAMYQEIMGEIAAEIPYIYLLRKIGVVTHNPDLSGVPTADVGGVQVLNPSGLHLLR